jgi:hypothetical protein
MFLGILSNRKGLYAERYQTANLILRACEVFDQILLKLYLRYLHLAIIPLRGYYKVIVNALHRCPVVNETT